MWTKKLVGVAALLVLAVLLGAVASERLIPREPLPDSADVGRQGEVEHWTCAMHPSVKMPEPGRCPICGMDLTPVRGGGAGADHGHAAMPAESVPGTDPLVSADRSVFQVDPRRRQLLNVQFTEAQRRPLEKTVRAVGTLELDERRISHVNTKIKGWIDEVFVDFNLAHVQKGDPLFSIYSPELVATQEEYLLAVRTAEELASSSFEHVSGGARALVRSARRRLDLFDVTTAQVEALEKAGEVRKTITVYSPASGHIVTRSAFPNMYVTPETPLYTIADHSTIWAMVDIYEIDIGFIRPGQRVAMTTAAYPGHSFQGKITYVYPHLESQTRTMKVRLEFPNPDLKLMPEMYVNAELKIPMGVHLTVPEGAVLRTGTRDLVFVDLGEGNLQLRQVEVGPKTGDLYPVLEGLEAGERVVTAANFLIDAESRIQGVEAAWETPKPRGQAGEGR